MLNSVVTTVAGLDPALRRDMYAESPRDVVEGAWNLKFWRVSQALFLNYNLHLAHHRQPGAPWTHLPRLVRASDPNPSFCAQKIISLASRLPRAKL